MYTKDNVRFKLQAVTISKDYSYKFYLLSFLLVYRSVYLIQGKRLKTSYFQVDNSDP